MGFVKTACEKLRKLGALNKPVYTVAAVALFKGILRPTFTMMDKEQDSETKKYAAIREGATELIAIPTYVFMSWAAEKLAPAFSPKGKNMEQVLRSSKTTLGFLGVCIAALYAIPKLCNMAMPHIMKALNINKPEDKKHKIAAVNEQQQNVKNISIDKNNQVQSPYAKTPVSMKGGMRI